MAIQPLSRRSALRGAAVAGLGAVVGFVVARAGRGDAPRPGTAANAYGPGAPSGDRELARLDQLPSGGGLVVADDKIVLTRGSDDVVHGFSAICTHQGCPVSSVAAGAIVCPCHGSRFDAATGAVLTGPATRPLPPLPVEVRDGVVWSTT
jgi:Rieske Fe-S protein